MLIRHARLHPYALPLRAEWKTAAGAFAIREGWLLHIETEDGRSGYGDCAPLPGPCAHSGTETGAQAHAALDGYARWLPGHSVGEALQTLTLQTLALPGDIALAPAARCAIECALLDLAAQAAGVGLGHFLRGAPCASDVAVNAALGGLDANSEDAVRKACADGFTVLKLKVGSAPVDADIAHLQRLAALLPADAQLRLDANRAWSESDAARFLTACAGLPVEQLEEPLADPQPAALARLQAAIGLLRQQPERGADLLARIERESVRMDRLVSELLALSRLEVGVAGRLEEAVDLRELLDALVEDARFEAQAGARRVDYAAPEATTPLAIRGDAELLHRALENVVRNALKHSPAGGRVSVALAREAGGAGYRIRVADDGPGVPEAELQAIFAPFYRAAAGSPADGYGLGLAITQRVVALHGGRIEAANRPGGGLCVNIFLPRRESAPTLA